MKPLADDEPEPEAAFEGDVVTKYTPPSFALEFVRAMRKRSGLSHIPSVRTSIALPRFLTARYFRTGQLTAKDYVEAAVYLTTPEDQGAAFEVARELLFPKDRIAQKPAEQAAVLEVAGAMVVSQDTPVVDEGASVLESLAGMNLDLGNLDLAALDQMLDAQVAAASEMKSLDLITQLSSSDDPAHKSLAALATTFGGAAELEADGIHDEASARRFLLERLLGGLGELAPETIADAARSGFAEPLLDDAARPWERAGLHVATGQHGEANAILDELLSAGNARDLGRALRFIRAGDAPAAAPYQSRALSSARHLADWAEILDGLGTFVPPPDALIVQSARENIRLALQAATVMDTAFRTPSFEYEDWSDEQDDDTPEEPETPDQPPLRHAVFDRWADGLTESPGLDVLVDICVPTQRWNKLVEAAVVIYRAEMAVLVERAPDDRMDGIRAALQLAGRLKETKTTVGKLAASELVTSAMVVVGSRTRFLPLLDAILDLGLVPHDAAAVVAAGTALDIAEEEIYARLSQPLEQLKFLIEGNVQDLRRYLDLVDKITHVPSDLLEHLIACCVRDGNRMGLALLLAVALGPVLARAGTLVSTDLVDASFNYRGIGGGENLLLQWYEHRDSVPSDFKDRVRALAKQALLDAALVWMHAGVGGAEKGLVPQSRTRPYRAGDDLDLLDIDGTLESLVLSGKAIEQISDEDLLVSDATSGRAGFGVLIDISGSMSGRDLAVCAIATVMLLGRLKPEELALALFESNTHVIKGFASTRDLDEVANELLDLRATGGTRVDAALRFMADEFASQPELERRVFFLLSDFEFFESKDELSSLLDELQHMDVSFIGAGHGHVSKTTSSLFTQRLGGQVTKIPSIAKLPELLLQALAWVASGSMR
jgi:Mg-chelatase subunit ChlD